MNEMKQNRKRKEYSRTTKLTYSIEYLHSQRSHLTSKDVLIFQFYIESIIQGYFAHVCRKKIATVVFRFFSPTSNEYKGGLSPVINDYYLFQLTKIYRLPL